MTWLSVGIRANPKEQGVVQIARQVLVVRGDGFQLEIGEFELPVVDGGSHGRRAEIVG